MTGTTWQEHMRFTRFPIEGLRLVEPDIHRDERGFFARVYCADAFRAEGLEADFVQRSVSFNHRRGTLRGLHFQLAPHAETKLVRCTSGAVFDVALDLRRGSPTFGQSQALLLSAENRAMFYIPAGFAHGFLTLSDNSELAYEIMPAYVPGAGAGVAHDDPVLGIAWPEAVAVISDKDRALPRLAQIAPL